MWRKCTRIHRKCYSWLCYYLWPPITIKLYIKQWNVKLNVFLSGIHPLSCICFYPPESWGSLVPTFRSHGVRARYTPDRAQVHLIHWDAAKCFIEAKIKHITCTKFTYFFILLLQLRVLAPSFLFDATAESKHKFYWIVFLITPVLFDMLTKSHRAIYFHFFPSCKAAVIHFLNQFCAGDTARQTTVLASQITFPPLWLKSSFI